MGWLVTLMLAGGGALCVFCAWRNYEWYLRLSFFSFLGRKWNRRVLIALGLFILVPGVLRMVCTRVIFSEEDAHFFTQPRGFGLMGPDVGVRLRSTPGVFSYRGADDSWREFALVVKPEQFPALLNPSSLFVDVEGGFLVNERAFSGKKCTGVMMHFDKNYRLCDNVLFSKTPLSSSEFIVLVWDEPTSRAFGTASGLLSTYHRRGTEVFAEFVK